MNCGLSAPRFERPTYDGTANVSLAYRQEICERFSLWYKFGGFCWVFIEIELDVLQNFFAFVLRKWLLATDAVSSSKHITFHLRTTYMYSFITYNDVDAV